MMLFSVDERMILNSEFIKRADDDGKNNENFLIVFFWGGNLYLGDCSFIILVYSKLFGSNFFSGRLSRS